MGTGRFVDRECEDLADNGASLLHGLAQTALELRQHVGIVALDGQTHRVGGAPGAGQGGSASSTDGLRDEVAPGAGRAAHGLRSPDPVAGEGQDRPDSEDTVEASGGAIDPPGAGQPAQVVHDEELAGTGSAGLSQSRATPSVMGARGGKHRESQGTRAGAGVDDTQPLRPATNRIRYPPSPGVLHVTGELGLDLGRGGTGVFQGAGQRRGDMDGQDLLGPSRCAAIGVRQFLNAWT